MKKLVATESRVAKYKTARDSPREAVDKQPQP